MKMSVVKLLLFLLLVAVTYSSRDRNNKQYKVVCYWGAWSFYRPGNGKFTAEDANPHICTHLIYGFAKLNYDNTIAVFDPDEDTSDTKGMYQRWNHLRTVDPHLTTMIAIGGWNEGSDKYSMMASNPSTRKIFVDSVVKFLQKYDFDGLDVDWEYPTMKAVGDADRVPGNVEDRLNYIELLRELSEAFRPHGYILSTAVSAGKPTIDRAYDVPKMNQYLDIINLMTYDFHGGWENKTAHNAPLHSRPQDNQLDKEFTVEFAVDHWLQLGVDPKKIVMGMPLYGRTFTLAAANNFGIGSIAVGKGGAAGPLTRLVGILGYNEICQYLKTGVWKVHWDEVQKIPYAVNGNQWIGFDDEQSIKDKVNFLKSKGLGGGMVWSIDTDDFEGLCGKGKYPLLKTISRELNSVDGPDTKIDVIHPSTSNPNHSTVSVTHNPTPTHKPDGHFKCKGSGFFADPSDKTIFHECVNNGPGQFQDIVYHCGTGTIYDEVHHVCKMP